ncbi:MAG: hypothetical protein ACK5X3_23450 [Pseudomonadota bacterium]
MSALVTVLTSRKTTAAAVLSGLALLLFDAQFITMLHDLGVSDALTAKAVTIAKATTYALAALGYSPLKKPAQTPPVEGA